MYELYVPQPIPNSFSKGDSVDQNLNPLSNRTLIEDSLPDPISPSLATKIEKYDEEITKQSKTVIPISIKSKTLVLILFEITTFLTIISQIIAKNK